MIPFMLEAFPLELGWQLKQTSRKLLGQHKDGAGSQAGAPQGARPTSHGWAASSGAPRGSPPGCARTAGTRWRRRHVLAFRTRSQPRRSGLLGPSWLCPRRLSLPGSPGPDDRPAPGKAWAGPPGVLGASHSALEALERPGVAAPGPRLSRHSRAWRGTVTGRRGHTALVSILNAAGVRRGPPEVAARKRPGGPPATLPWSRAARARGRGPWRASLRSPHSPADASIAPRSRRDCASHPGSDLTLFLLCSHVSRGLAGSVVGSGPTHLPDGVPSLPSRDVQTNVRQPCLGWGPRSEGSVTGQAGFLPFLTAAG